MADLLHSLGGIVGLLAVAWLLSSDRRLRVVAAAPLSNLMSATIAGLFIGLA